MSSAPRSTAGLPPAKRGADRPRLSAQSVEFAPASGKLRQAGSSSAIMKDAARGSAAAALLPSKEILGGAYFDLRHRIDQIVAQAKQQGSLAVAVSGLNSIRQTLDSLSRLAGHDRAQVNVAVQTNVNVDLTQIAERLIRRFDQEPELKARIAEALVEIDDEQAA